MGIGETMGSGGELSGSKATVATRETRRSRCLRLARSCDLVSCCLIAGGGGNNILGRFFTLPSSNSSNLLSPSFSSLVSSLFSFTRLLLTSTWSLPKFSSFFGFERPSLNRRRFSIKGDASSKGRDVAARDDDVAPRFSPEGREGVGVGARNKDSRREQCVEVEVEVGSLIEEVEEAGEAVVAVVEAEEAVVAVSGPYIDVTVREVVGVQNSRSRGARRRYDTRWDEETRLLGRKSRFPYREYRSERIRSFQVVCD